ncbi:MAG: MbnP family protein [Bacteroidota bacterium]
MKNSKSLPLILLPFFLLLLVAGCKKEEAASFVRLNFDHLVQGQALQLNDTWYDCAAGHKFQVARLKYYVSNFTLTATDGSVFESDEVHYRDVEKEDTRSLMLKDVPKGEYASISFIFGLDEDTNVDGGLPNTTTNINMEWPIPGDQGYHYMKFEGKYDSLGTGVLKNFNLHTGAAKNNQNYVQITLPFHHAVTVDGGTWALGMSMDLNEWLQNPATYDFEDFGSMIMENQDAQQVLKENGKDVFSVVSFEKE